MSPQAVRSPAVPPLVKSPAPPLVKSPAPPLATTAPPPRDPEPELGALDVVVTVDSVAPPPAEALPSSEAMSEQMQEKLFGVLYAAFNRSLLPLLEKQRDLEARLERLQQAEARAASPAGGVAVAPSPAPTQVPALPQEPSKPRSMAPSTSIVPTSYGFVTASVAPPPRPPIEVALEGVGPIDVPDFGRGRRSAGTVLVAILLAGVLAAIVATILSHT